jgi:hypothetical protein
METLILRGIRMRLHPAMTTNSSMTAQMNDVLRGPGATLPTLNPVMKAVGFPTAPLTQTTRPGCYYLPAVALKPFRH